MKLWIVLILIGLCGWLAWDKMYSHVSERFHWDVEEKAESKEPSRSPGLQAQRSRERMFSGGEPEVRPVVGAEGVVSRVTVPQYAAGASSPPSPAEPDPVKWVVIDRATRYAVTPELVEFLRLASRGDDSPGAGGLSDRSGVYHDAARSRLFVSLPENRVAQVTAILDAADSPPRQVTVEVVVCLARLTSGQEFGMEWLARWSLGSGDMSSGQVAIGAGSVQIQAGAFELALTSAVSAGHATVVSRPSVGAELGAKALISSGREVGVASTDSLNGNAVTSIDFKKVALSIEATVFSSGDGFRVLVVQKNDELAGSSTIDGREVPEIATQSLESSLLLIPGCWASGGSVVVSRDSRASGGFRWLPSTRRTSRTDREEIGVFVRVVEGLELSRPPDEFAPGPEVLRAEPVPTVTVRPRKRGLPFGGGVRNR